MGVNAVADMGTYCTSLLARTPDGGIIHVRNLDFMYQNVMKKLVFEAIFVKGGQVKARAPLIAGFYGAYTGTKPGVFSISYNVRESGQRFSQDSVIENFKRHLDSNRYP